MRIILFVFLMLFSKNVLALDGIASADSDKPIEITSDSLEVKRMENMAIFTGEVEAVQGRVNLRSDKMTVYYRPKEEQTAEQNSVSKIEVDGNVLLTTPEETAKGDAGVYDVDEKIVRLRQNVVVTKGENVVKGDNLIYNMSTGESKVWSEGGKVKGKKERVKGVFVPESK